MKDFILKNENLDLATTQQEAEQEQEQTQESDYDSQLDTTPKD